MVRPDRTGSLLATCSNDHSIKIWDIQKKVFSFVSFFSRLYFIESLSNFENTGLTPLFRKKSSYQNARRDSAFGRFAGLSWKIFEKSGRPTFLEKKFKMTDDSAFKLNTAIVVLNFFFEKLGQPDFSNLLDQLAKRPYLVCSSWYEFLLESRLNWNLKSSI